MFLRSLWYILFNFFFLYVFYSLLNYFCVYMLVYVLVSPQGELFKQTAPGGINNELTKTLTCNKENGGGKNGTYCSCVHTVLLCINDDKILALFCKPLRCSVAVE